MPWIDLMSYFIGGALLANGIPHLTSGLTGRQFQSPFAKPPGQGLSSSTVNVVWGFLNLMLGYVLIDRIGAFDPRSNADVVAAGLGFLLMSVVLARLFGRFNGGNAP